MNNDIELLFKRGFKEVKNHRDTLINKEGKLLRVKKDRQGNNVITNVKISLTVNGVYKFNTIHSGKCLILHNVIYQTFKGDFDGILQFKDGNKKNYSLENLITIEELLKFYNEKNN